MEEREGELREMKRRDEERGVDQKMREKRK